MQYQKAKKLKEKKFKRLYGVEKQTFYLLVKIVKEQKKKRNKRGVKPKLLPEEQVLLTLQYWREYRTLFHLGQLWDISESTVCRIVRKIENIIINSGYFSLPGKKELINKRGEIEAVIIDVTETPIERPSRNQKSYYSGKKKQHTYKSQLVINKINILI